MLLTVWPVAGCDSGLLSRVGDAVCDAVCAVAADSEGQLVSRLPTESSRTVGLTLCQGISLFWQYALSRSFRLLHRHLLPGLQRYDSLAVLAFQCLHADLRSRQLFHSSTIPNSSSLPPSSTRSCGSPVFSGSTYRSTLARYFFWARGEVRSLRRGLGPRVVS